MHDSNVFQMGTPELFDATVHTQGGLPHLMQYLWDRYVEHLTEELEKRTVLSATIETAKRKAPATHFAQWATEFLKENRATESFFLDANMGLRLTNNAMVAISPGVEIKGTMQDSTAIQVTEGKSQADKTRVADGGSLRI